jgi:hypothetical protein
LVGRSTSSTAADVSRDVLYRAAAAYQVDHQDNQCQHQEQVNESASYVQTKAEKPKNQDHYENRPEHVDLLISYQLSFCLSADLNTEPNWSSSKNIRREIARTQVNRAQAGETHFPQPFPVTLALALWINPTVISIPDMQLPQQCLPALSTNAQGVAKSNVSRILVSKSFASKDLASAKSGSSNLTPAIPEI